MPLLKFVFVSGCEELEPEVPLATQKETTQRTAPLAQAQSDSEDDKPLMKEPSRKHLRDELEISNRVVFLR